MGVESRKLSITMLTALMLLQSLSALQVVAQEDTQSESPVEVLGLSPQVYPSKQPLGLIEYTIRTSEAGEVRDV